ncbi:MAG: DNA polymerase I [bacterium]|nr:DNA polymerase I [bacterium]
MARAPITTPTLIIIDGHAILHRAFHALPPMLAPSGELVNAVYGFTTILLKVLRDYAPTHIAVTFDTAAATFRHEMYGQYKATREEKPDELYAQIDHIEDVLAAFHIPTYAVDGFEADDLIGTIVAQVKRKKIQTLILTGDLDTLQLVSPTVHVLALTTSMSAPTEYDEDAVRARYGLDPAQLIDFKALAGDPSDNIPGVSGIGKKTATQVLQEFGTIAHALRAAAKGGAQGTVSARVLEKIRDAEEAIALGRELVTIKQDAPITFQLDDAARRPVDRDATVAKFRELGFATLITRLPVSAESSCGDDAVEALHTPQDLAQLSQDLARTKAFAFAIAHDEGSPRTAHARAIGFSYDDHAVVAEPWGAALAATARVFADGAIAKTAHDAKAALHLLGRSHIALRGLADDTMLLSYLLAPGTRKHDLVNVALAELGVELNAAPGSVTAAPAAAIAALQPLLAKRLADEGLERVYREIDLPLVPVLHRMEHIGIMLDATVLAGLSAKMHEQLDAADARIVAHAGHEFNIDSPKQLKVVLFEELGLEVRGLKKTAKGMGLSTAASELEKLRGAHPIIDDVFVHRELKKLVSTYVDALPELVDPQTGRVHTTFNQCVASTGRLSSDSPNLQNIPVTQPWGPAIRSAFVAERGWVLLALDYSQVELRIAASLSGDRALAEAFRSGSDIHAATGALVFGIAPELVTKDQRRVAKAINFGILYGMGAGTLAKTADINREEAGEYISAYFAAYPELHAWIEETKATARKRGFVETLFGRKRYLPEITSGVPMVAAAAERMAVNMPIQGTQADLVRMAMVAADAWVQHANTEMRSEGPTSGERVRMLLQVHDELVFEVREDFLKTAAPALINILENIHTFPVPVSVEASTGTSWGALKKLEH